MVARLIFTTIPIREDEDLFTKKGEKFTKDPTILIKTKDGHQLYFHEWLLKNCSQVFEMASILDNCEGQMKEIKV